MSDTFRIHTIVSRPFDENTSVIWRQGRTDCVVVDPGLEPHLIREFLDEQELTPVAILNTHGHGDHIGGNADLKKTYPLVPLVIGRHEEKLLTDPFLNVSGIFGMPITSPPADRLVDEGDVVDYAGLRFKVLEIPGHSPGHVVYLHLDAPAVVIGGDVLFRDGIGRMDFPGGNGDLLMDGIRRKLFTLPPETVIYPGHGPVTTIGHEKRFNPYVGDHERLA